MSFELLDINIVQELERVPHNTPVGKAPVFCVLSSTDSYPLCFSVLASIHLHFPKNITFHMLRDAAVFFAQSVAD